jgi:hypothetical protein
MKNGFSFAGTNAHRATAILPLSQVVDSIKSEYAEEFYNENKQSN